jgi:hypothetical protein
MAALEAHARADGRWLLLLDTETGGLGEPMYRHWGWTAYGVVVDHSAGPDGRLAATTFLSKRLAPG